MGYKGETNYKGNYTLFNCIWKYDFVLKMGNVITQIYPSVSRFYGQYLQRSARNCSILARESESLPDPLAAPFVTKPLGAARLLPTHVGTLIRF
jgi:hypothetical protein